MPPGCRGRGRPLRVGEPVVLSVEGGLVSGGQPPVQLEQLGEPVEPLGRRWHRQPHRLGLARVPNSDAEPGPPAGEDVQGRGGLDQQGRLPVGHRAHHGAEPDPRRAARR